MNSAGHDIKALWQQQPIRPIELDMSLVRSKARRFHWHVRLRNAIEYIAAVVVIFAFGRHLIVVDSPFTRIGSALIILATLYIVVYLHRHGAARTLPGHLGAKSSIDFIRTELERQRDLLSCVWLWYVAPFLPGFGFFIIGSAYTVVPPDWTRAMRGAIFIITLCALIASLNRWGARRLQRKIDELPKVETEVTNSHGEHT